MFKAIKEFFVGKPVSVANVIAPGGAPYKVPEPEATTPIPLVTETASAEKLASAYNETYKVEDDHPGAVRRVPETVLEVSVQEVTAPVVETKAKAPAKTKAPKLTVVKSEKTSAKSNAEKAPAKSNAEKAPAKPKAEKAPSKKKT